MRKKIITILGFMVIQSIFCLNIALAQNATDSSSNANSSAVGADQLLYKFNYTNKDNTNTKLSYVAGLPSGSWQDILTQVIKIVLGVTGTLALISFTVSGVMFLTAQGQEDKITKAKNLLLWSLGGLGIIAVSYALVIGISRLKFF